MVTTRTNVTPLARMIGQEERNSPYVSQNIDPIERTRNVVSEISSARFNRHTRITWGTNAPVVIVPASKPIKVIDQTGTVVRAPTFQYDEDSRT